VCVVCDGVDFFLFYLLHFFFSFVCRSGMNTSERRQTHVQRDRGEDENLPIQTDTQAEEEKRFKTKYNLQQGISEI
jgi:hypothetical protein